MARRFDKYEGLGNDFVVLDGARWPEAEVTPALARALCDRHTAVGADGVLWVGEAPDGVRMVIYNADGSRPEMCGNGVRCVVAWLADRGLVRDGGAVTVWSDAGPRPATLRGREGGAWRVEVEMGVARVDEAPLAVRVGDAEVPVRAVDVGNPHGVLFDAPGDGDELARAVAALPAFPHGVNVELVTREGDALRVRVRERGVGWTLACGTGACAVAAAAVREGRAPAGEPVRVVLDGGALEVTVDARSWRVRMTGPARRAYAGELDA